MKISPSTNPMRTGMRLVASAAICLVLASCGTADDSASIAVATQPIDPTPVPTTAPLSLPPAEDSLLAVAVLPTQPATDSEPAARNTEQPTTSETTTASAAPATTPTAIARVEMVQPAAITVSSASQWGDCVLAAAEQTDAVVLLDPIAAGTATDLTSVQLNSLAAASSGCDVVGLNLAGTDLSDHVTTASACLQAWLASSGGGSVFVGLTSIGWDQPTPIWAQAHLVDALADCFVGVSFASDVMAVVATDSTLNGAFDANCLAASFDASGTMRTFALALASNPAAAAMNVGLDDPWVFNCANAGQIVAAAAATDGVALSASTISCIDGELKRTDAMAQLVAGTADTDAVGLATLACLTDAEAAALLG